MKGGGASILPTVAIVSTTCALIVQNRERIVGGAFDPSRVVMTPLRQFFGRVFKKAQSLPFVPKKKNTDEDDNDEEEEKKETKTKSGDEGEEEETTTTTTTTPRKKREEEEEEEEILSSSEKRRETKREKESERNARTRKGSK